MTALRFQYTREDGSTHEYLVQPLDLVESERGARMLWADSLTRDGKAHQGTRQFNIARMSNVKEEKDE